MRVFEFIRGLQKNSLYVQSFYLSLSNVLVAGSGFLFWMFAARMYSPRDIGISSSILSAINLIVALSLVGLNFSLIRFYPKYKTLAVFSTFLVIFLTAIIFSGGYLVLASLLSDSIKEILTGYTAVFFVVFSVVGTLFRISGTVFIIKKQNRQYFYQNIIFSLRLLFLFVFGSFGMLGILGAYGVAVTIGFLYFLYSHDYLAHSRRTFFKQLTLRSILEYLKSSFRLSLANFLSSVFQSAPTQLMPMMILSILTPYESAQYYISFTVSSLIFIVPNALSTSFFVEGSRKINNVKHLIKQTILFDYSYLLIVSIFVLKFGGYLLMLFGESYVHGLDLLNLFVFSGFLVVIFNLYLILLNIAMRPIAIVVLSLLKAIFYLGLSYLLVPAYGIMGVGYALIITHLILIILIGGDMYWGNNDLLSLIETSPLIGGDDI